MTVHVNPDGTFTEMDADGCSTPITILPPGFTLCPWQVSLLNTLFAYESLPVHLRALIESSMDGST